MEKTALPIFRKPFWEFYFFLNAECWDRAGFLSLSHKPFANTHIQRQCVYANARCRSYPVISKSQNENRLIFRESVPNWPVRRFPFLRSYGVLCSGIFTFALKDGTPQVNQFTIIPFHWHISVGNLLHSLTRNLIENSRCFNLVYFFHIVFCFS